MRVIREEGVIYYPDLNIFFLDPKYWYDYYRQTGILPKPPSRKDKFLDNLFNFGMGKVGEWLFGGGSNPLSSILDLPKKIFDLPAKIAELPGTATEGILSFFDKLGSLFGGGTAATQAADFASQLKDLPLEVLQGITGKFDVADKAALVDEILGSAPMSKATSQSSGLFGNLAQPLAALGTFLDAYQKGKPSALGLGGTALAGLMNPATLPFSLIGMGIGSVFGKRKKRKKERKMAREIAGRLSPDLGISDVEGLAKVVRGNLNFFKDQNNIADWITKTKERISGVGEEPLRLLLIESEFLGPEKTKEQLKNLLDYEKWLQTKQKFANRNVLEMPPYLAMSQWANPFYKHKKALDALRAYSGNDPLLTELKSLLQ